MVEPLPDQKKKYLSWQDYLSLVSNLAKQLKSTRYRNIYAVPRGGLIIGVILSHKLNLPLINNPSDITYDTLVVDDIADSGSTLNSLKHKHTAVLHWRYSSEHTPVFYVEKLETDDWVVYPYEQTEPKDGSLHDYSR